MINVTDQALELLDTVRSNALAQQPSGDGISEPALRLVIHDNQVGVTLDQPSPEDRVLDFSGHPVLIIGPNVNQALSGTTIDVDSTPEGPRLTISSSEQGQA